jgi:hypothetical protein
MSFLDWMKQRMQTKLLTKKCEQDYQRAQVAQKDGDTPKTSTPKTVKRPRPSWER